MFAIPVFFSESFQLEHITPTIQLDGGSSVGSGSDPSSSSDAKVISNTNFPLPSPPNLVLRRSVATDSGDNVRLAIRLRRPSSSSDRLSQDCEGRSYLQVSTQGGA